MKNAVGLVCKMALLLYVQASVAGSADYVDTPDITQGEREFGVKYGSAAPLAGNPMQAAGIGLGYGVTDSWATEVILKRERTGRQDATLLEWENRFLFAEMGKYPVDVGLLSELEAPLAGHAPWELRLGPMFQTTSGKFQWNANVLFVRAFGAVDEFGVPFNTNLAYQWQMKYHWQADLQYGLQGMGELGKWNNWYKQAEQNHRVGPAVFGSFLLGNQQSVKYNAAWLFGTTAASPNHTFRMQADYEF